MSQTTDKIPFSIEIGRVIELLASQIYPTPFALLRENVQNSFDAILLRKHLGQQFEAKISVIIESTSIVVQDNGIGMSREDLKKHFWRAGSSSKNTEDARAAGVVGTFGIGAMANFGIAEELSVDTQSAKTQERTFCTASRSTLSVTEDCITFKELLPQENPGTVITAIVQQGKSINVRDAENYISQFVSFLPILIEVNGKNVSGQNIEDSIPQLSATWNVSQLADLGAGLSAKVELTGALSGEIRISLSDIQYGNKKLEGRLILKQGLQILKTFRSGFGLATTGLSSVYQLGGIADFLFLQPTAGREALTTESMQLLQLIINRVEEYISFELANRVESNSNAHFVTWVYGRKRFELCSYLRVRIEPEDSSTLLEIRDKYKQSPILVYTGSDPTTIKYASEDKPILVTSRGTDRRECELNYLRKYCKIQEITDEQKVLKYKSDSELSDSEKALSFRIASTLSSDYFIDAYIKFGTISHGLPVLITSRSNPVGICLDPNGQTVSLILRLFTSEYSAYNHMVKDFVRNMIFPRISDLVPSATRQGAEAFLKIINRTREVFEYDTEDLQSLTSIWEDYLNKKVTFQQATDRANKIATRSYQILDSSAAAHVMDVVPDVIQNEASTGEGDGSKIGPQPPIQRLDVSTPKKVLTIRDSEEPLKGYRCFLALTDRIREEKGDFFHQPHRTSVVWGGQRALFIFEHHSGNYGLYYDLQTQNLISKESGGGSFETCTIIMKNRIFIPIPPAIQESFLPI
jgi:molecular chaperone HtpG